MNGPEERTQNVAVYVQPEPKRAIPWVKNDGGRSSTGWKAGVRDCVVRAIAIAEDRPYMDVYREVSALMKKAGYTSARNGVYDSIWTKYLAKRGWKRVETFAPGSKKMRMRAEDMPEGTIICNLHKHLACVKDGVLHDTWDCSKGGEARVLSYWFKP